jgi:predicted P-loop ATPase
MNGKSKVRDIRQGGKGFAPNGTILMKNWVAENYDLRRNEVTGMIEGHPAGTEEEFKILNENTVYIQLKEEGHKVTMQDLIALLKSDFVVHYDPFLDYFDHLPTPVLGTIEKFAGFVKAECPDQFNLHFKKMLVRVIACALEDQTFNKQCFTLVGSAQGTGKSTWCRSLLPQKLRAYSTESISLDKDGQIALAQNLLIDLDELSILSKFEINQLKAYFSRDRVSVRHPFEKKQTTEPRRASFIASTNEQNFLNDTTGSVRWLCFEILSIDWEYRHMPIDTVWAEAYYLYKSGFEYNLTGQELRENEVRNERFQIISPEVEYCQKYLSPGDPNDGGAPIWTATELKDYLNTKSQGRADIKSAEKLGKALTFLGFKRVSQRVGDKSRYGYQVKCM